MGSPTPVDISAAPMKRGERSVTGRVHPDWITVAAIAVVVHVVAIVTHEGIGHGGACVLTGCTPQLVTTMLFRGDEHALSAGAVRFIAAGGTIANLLAASLTAWFLKRQAGAAGRTWFFLWLLTTVNLFQLTGYLLYSGILNIGDWAEVVGGFKPAWPWRIALASIGGFTYWLTVNWSMRQLGRRLRSSGEKRVGEAYRYTIVAYLAAGILALMAGLREPGGATIVLISGVAATFGGTSGLAWGPQFLRNARFDGTSDVFLSIPRSSLAILAAAAAGSLFVFVLGPGIALRF